MERTEPGRVGTATGKHRDKEPRLWYEKPAVLSASYVLALLWVLVASSWQPQGVIQGRGSRASLPGFKSQLSPWPQLHDPGQVPSLSVPSAPIWNMEPTSLCQRRLRKDETSQHLCPWEPVPGTSGCSKSMFALAPVNFTQFHLT